LGQMDSPQFDRWLMDWVLHRQSDRFDILQFSKGAPYRHPKRISAAIDRRGQVAARLIHSFKIAQRNRRAQPGVLAKRLNLDAASPLACVDPQPEPLR